MRRLIFIPIVHTSADMGSMSEGLKKVGMSKIGRRKWLENQEKIKKFWDEVEHEIDALNLDCKHVRVYQDGLPVAGKTGAKIVNSAADKGSRNFQIIRKLIEKGATIEATESPELLKKEYEYIKAFVTAKFRREKKEAERKYDEVKEKLIEERDNFIAKIIDTTLKDNETGILFLGAHHNIKSKLPSDTKIISLN